MIASEFYYYKRKIVFELLWLFVNTNPIALMEQFENVPSMFHQNLGYQKTKIPVSAWLTGICFGGCPVGLEPTTFRTTSRISNFRDSLYLSAFPQILILVLRLFCGYLRKDRFCFNKSPKI